MKEPIVEHFTGDFDSYIPMLIGNGDLGGSFDPFCGTWFDQLRSGQGPKDDIRTMLRARLIAQDFWEEQFLDPGRVPLSADTAADVASQLKEGRGYESSAVRGSPFDIFLGPASADFPGGVQDHVQQLNLEEGILSAAYTLEGKRYEVECFVHPRLSLLVYHLRAGGSMEFRIKAGQGVHREGEVLIARSSSNIYCPAVAGIYADRGRIKGDRIALPAGESVLYLAYGHTRLGDQKAQVAAALGEARRNGYAALRKEHTRWWADFWSRSDLSIPDARMQQMYYRSLYYLGASLPRRTKTPAFEAGISGCFPVFMTGYHIQDSVYQVLPMVNASHLELVEPMLEWFLEVLPVAQEIARSMFWLKGARYLWHGGPGLLPALPGHSHYVSCAWEHHVNGWVVLAVERYLDACGWDKDRARRYYPVVSEVARFFSSMLEPRGPDKLQIRYLPSQSQAETTTTINQPNIFDVLVSAKWSLQVASRMSRLLGVDAQEGRRWKKEAEAIDLSFLQRKDGTYLLFEGDKGAHSKVCVQFMGVLFPVGLAQERESLLATYQYLQKHVRFGCCAWDPGYATMALARLGETKLAAQQLNRMFSEGYTEAPWIMFRESAPSWLNTATGRMPYYLAAHGLYAQGIHEMLVQDWRGKVDLFPACPFEEASFRLRAGGRMVEATKTGRTVKRRRRKE